jgi:hypothetical protein
MHLYEDLININRSPKLIEATIRLHAEGFGVRAPAVEDGRGCDRLLPGPIRLLSAELVDHRSWRRLPGRRISGGDSYGGGSRTGAHEGEARRLVALDHGA